MAKSYLPKRVTAVEAEMINPDLPPPGYERNETKAQRTDALQEAAETQPIEKEAFDPSRFRLDNEIASKFNSLEVSGALNDHVYCWVRRQPPGDPVREKLAIRVRDTQTGYMVPTWEVVHGAMPEATECTLLGQRVIGDVLLMRCRKDKYAAIRQYEEWKAARRLTGADATLADEAAKRGMQMRSVELADPQQTITAAEVQRHMLGKQYDQAMREGTIPGMPAPGR